MLKRCLKFLTMLLAIIPAGRAVGAQTEKPWFFAVLSDPQLGMYAKDQNFAQETANLEFAIANLNRLHPRFVVVCGDLVNRTGDAAEIAEYKRILKKLDPSIPVYNVAGNHDVSNMPTPAMLNTYRANIGRDYYTFTQGNVLGIVVDSNLIASTAKAPEAAREQEEWLKKTLAEAGSHPDQQIVVFQHIPYFDHAPTEKDDYFNISEPTRRKYLDLLETANVHYVFTGHYHRNGGGTDGRLNEIVTGAVGMPIGSVSGFRLVMVDGEKLQTRWYCLGGIPNAIAGPELPVTACSQ